MKSTKWSRDILRRFIGNRFDGDNGESFQHLGEVFGYGKVNESVRLLLREWQRRLERIANDPIGSDASPLAWNMMRTAENGLRILTGQKAVQSRFIKDEFKPRRTSGGGKGRKR